MPTGQKLGIGTGIARGVLAFVSQSHQLQLQKEEEKRQKNAYLASILARQLEDDNLSYFERGRIMRLIPEIIGVKTDKPLDEIFGLDKLNEPAEVQKGQAATPETNIQGQGNIQDIQGNPQTGELGTAGLDLSQTSISQKGTQATQDVPSLERRGDLSPAIIKKKLIIETEKAKDEQDIEKQTKLAQINNSIQLESLKALGYTKEVARGFKDGRYKVVMANASGQTKEIDLGDMNPEAILKANLSNNRPSKSMQALEDYYLTQTNPETGKSYSQEEAFSKALEDTHKAFQLQQDSRSAYITSLNQSIAGTKPITLAQNADDTRANTNLKLQVTKDVDETKSKMESALVERDKLGELKTQAGLAAANADREFEAVRAEDDDPDSTAYKNAVKKAEDLREKYNALEKQYSQAHANYVLANSLYSSAVSRAGQFGTGTSKYSTQVQGAINLVRKNNPTQTANMTDEEIYNYLVSKGKIK